MSYSTREEWLLAAIEAFKPLFVAQGYTVPINIRVSCGWPLGVRSGSNRQAIGQAFPASQSADGALETFISPTLYEPVLVLGTLLHEVCHHVVGCKEGHKAPFAKCARSVGLTGKMTATVVSEALEPTLASISGSLGAYPHASVTCSSGTKKQGMRMLKLECPDCGYIVRTTAKWIAVGIPVCACGTQFSTDEGRDNET